jgi:hypothetical protein
MTGTTLGPQWQRRLARIRSQVEQIYIPEIADRDMQQDREWCYVVIAGKQRRIRFHDYQEIYRIPGLYEKLFYERLGCCSPSRVVQLLEEVLVDFGDDPVVVEVSMSDVTVQITMTAPGDLDRGEDHVAVLQLGHARHPVSAPDPRRRGPRPRLRP